MRGAREWAIGWPKRNAVTVGDVVVVVSSGWVESTP